MLSDEPLLLWSGYDQPGATRRPSEVCVSPEIGGALQGLCRKRCPRVVVEVGTGFGVSGWYMLHALAGYGHLYTFEANREWAREARERLQGTNASGFTLIVGRFEDELDAAIGEQRIDMAFLDGIHREDVVRVQADMVIERRAARLVLAVDDVGAVPQAWQWLAGCSKSSAVVHGRLGVAEF